MAENDWVLGGRKTASAVCFWVSHIAHTLSFRPLPAYERMSFHSLDEMWAAVHKLIETGYLAQ